MLYVQIISNAFTYFKERDQDHTPVATSRDFFRQMGLCVNLTRIKQ